jgi:MATE family multidrug resistance protein
MTFLPSQNKAGNPALATAKPYLRIRAFSFLPMLLSFVGFSAFRGTMDVQTSVKVTLAATSVTVLLEPILIYVLGIGVRGAAMATLCGEVVGAIVYLKLLLDRKLMLWGKVFRIPPWKSLEPLVTGGIALQLRSICLNFTFLMVARVIQSLDDTGVSAAAHALAAQTFQLGGIVIGALGMASQTMVPNAMVKVTDGESSTSSISNAKPLINRLLMWGSSLGFLIGLVQLVFLPAILRSSPLTDVREAARVPALIAIAFQGINGVVSVGEGIMMGSGSFTWLSINNILAALGYLAALRVFPEAHGLTGVWMSLSCFTTIRLLGVLVHLFVRSPPPESSNRKS